jgi:small subunit ribosomal protein S19e
MALASLVLKSTAQDISMANVRTIQPERYNQALAKALLDIEEFMKPVWVDFVKSGPHRQRPIQDPEFWQKRAASILRQIYIHGTVGVQKLRTRYGGRKDRGMKPARFAKSGGKIIRTILQQAEAAGLLEKSTDKKSGRKLTLKGREFLESFAK